MNTAVTKNPAVETRTTAAHSHRSLEMHLMNEALARAHMQERLREAEHERLAYHVAMAKKMRKRAENASLRARRALALAVM
jgi:hypothetical protein